MAAKTAQYVFTIWLVLTLNFALPRLIPGNPLAELDNPQGLPIPLSEDQRLRLMAYYGLDKPLAQQYGDYLTGLLHADLGWSISYNAPVLAVLLGRLRWTLPLVGVATLLYVSLGILLGSYSAWHRKRAADGLLLTVTSVAGSFPAFFLAMLLIIVFGVKLKLLPLGAAQSPLYLDKPWLEHSWDLIRHAVLPILTLVLTNVGEVYYLTRNAMLQTLGDTYITVARAKGLAERWIRLRHVLPNALLPIISLVAMRFGFLIMGAVMVETTFAYPGIGSAIVEASTSRDYPLLQGAFALIMVSVMGANLLADILQGLLDPRIRRRARSCAQ
jgi:peptide/nickel transport system permease protein